MSEPIFYKDQKVGCLLFGEGVVQCVREIPTAFVFPLEVLFEDGIGCRNYTMNGSYFTDSRPTLYPIEQYMEIIALIKPFTEPKFIPQKGDYIWTWDDGDSTPALRKFVKMEGGCYICENSHNSEATVRWQNASAFIGELPEIIQKGGAQ